MSPVLAEAITETEVTLLHNQIERLTEFANYLEQPFVEINNDNAFAMIIRQAIDSFEIETERLAREFGVNRTTIGRWKAGKNAPQPMARPLVVAWLREEARAKAEALKKLLSLRSRSMVTA